MTVSNEVYLLSPWIEHLPSEWKYCRLDEVADVLFSNVDKHIHDNETPVKLCNYVDVYKNERITNEIDFMEASAELREIIKFQIKRGDLLVTKDSETSDDIAIPAFVAEELPGVLCGYHLAMIRPRSERISGEFLFWLHSSKQFRAQYEAKAPGVTRFGLSQHVFREAIIPLPPFLEQERIATYLESSCTAIDEAVSVKRRQLNMLDALDRSSLHSAFANNNWHVERIKDITIKIGSGITPEGGASGYLNEGIPLLRSQNVHFDGLHLDDVAFISEETHAEMASSQLKPHDVLLNITGASIGRCTFVPDDFGEGNVNQHVCIIRVNHEIDYRFLTSYLSSPIGQGQILSAFTGASRQGLSQKDLGLIYVPLPTCDIQRQVVSALEQERSKQNQVRMNIQSQIAALTAYRKSLIHECVTGQRRVAEADLVQVVAKTDLAKVKAHV